jgi:hypothetical protein
MGEIFAFLHSVYIHRSIGLRHAREGQLRRVSLTNGGGWVNKCGRATVGQRRGRALTTGILCFGGKAMVAISEESISSTGELSTRRSGFADSLEPPEPKVPLVGGGWEVFGALGRLVRIG